MIRFLATATSSSKNDNNRFFSISSCTCLALIMFVLIHMFTINISENWESFDGDGNSKLGIISKHDKACLWKQIPNRSNLSEMALYNTKNLIFHRIAKTGSSVVKSMFSDQHFVNESNMKHKMGMISGAMDNKAHHFSSELLARENISSNIYTSYMKKHLNKLYDNCLTTKTDNDDDHDDKYCVFVTHMIFVDNDGSSIMTKNINATLEPNSTYLLYENLLSTFNVNRYANYKAPTQFITFVRNPLKRIESFFYYLRGMSGGWRGESIASKKLNGNLYQLESDEENKGKKTIMYSSNGTQIKVNKTIFLNIEKEYDDKSKHKAGLQVANVLNSTNFYSFKKCIDDMKKENNNICWLQENYMTRFYCGQNKNLCNVNNMTKISLDHSISNLNKYFSFVGILEHFDVSIYLLQLKFPHIIKWNKFENIFNTNVSVALKNTKNILNRLSGKHGYGKYQHSKLITNSTEYHILVERNKLDILLFNYVNDYYEKYIIPSLQD